MAKNTKKPAPKKSAPKKPAPKKSAPKDLAAKAPTESATICSTCLGSGKVKTAARPAWDRLVPYDVCPACGGRGTVGGAS